MSDPWRTRESRVLLEHERIRVVEDSVTLPTGGETAWLRFEKLDDFVSVICLRGGASGGESEGEGGREVLVAAQYNHSVQRAVTEFPGGVVDDHETPLQAAHRELEEETGLRARIMTPLGSFLVNPRRTPIQGFVFVAEGFSEGDARPEPEEFIDLEWLSLTDFEERLRGGEAVNGNLLAAWTLFRLAATASSA